ncbi:ABC transporter substrate-binding protein [Bosea sp. 47.2.35]|uniref:ABC transporter substrate-binding protein n=1 Tax=Bosea sp. 47.2.35 TaxID=2969304 RepID=UPI00214F7ED9|nr:ABC transporter substrate-binding protein [Bosea sp. 47.2.35]MCR4522212.1 ABC transporter substrate-binding protein [Bosea sp. 47.2.35]
MDRRTFLRAASSLVVVGLAGAAPAQEPDVYRIGAILSMSGATPHYGTVMSRGALVAVDEINAAGGIDGRKLELVIEDHKSGSTQAAVAGMNRLINVVKTPAVLSSFSGPTVAIAPISKEKQVFVLNGGGVSLKMIGVSPYMFHNRSLATDLAAAAVRRAKDRGFKRIAQIAGRSEFGDSVIAASQEVAKKLGMEVVATEQFAADATNIDTQVAKLRAAKPDVVLNWPTTPQAGLVVKRVREIGMEQPIISMEWTNEDTKLAGVASSNGVEVATDYFAPAADNPMGQRFYDEYKKRYGEEPDFYAANYYEAVQVIATLIRRTKAKGGDFWTGARLTEALWEDPAFDSVYGGKMTFQKNGVALKRVAILKVDEGALKLERFLPAQAD